MTFAGAPLSSSLAMQLSAEEGGMRLAFTEQGAYRNGDVAEWEEGPGRFWRRWRARSPAWPEASALPLPRRSGRKSS